MAKDHTLRAEDQLFTDQMIRESVMDNLFAGTLRYDQLKYYPKVGINYLFTESDGPVWTIGDSATVTLSNGVKVAVTKEATLGAATLTSSARAYFAVAPSSSISNSVSATNVVVCYYGAGVTSVTVVGNSIQWTAVSITTPVLIEREDNGSYTTVTTTASGGSYSYNGASESGTTLRLFDGVSFFSVTITEAASYYEVAEEYSLGYVLFEDPNVGHVSIPDPIIGYIQ